MGANVGPNTGLAQIGSKILRAISDAIPENERYDIKSTEELLNKLRNYYENALLKENKVILSMDIKNFYPSIQPQRAAQIARIMWERSSLKIENIDVDRLTYYLGKQLPKHTLKKENIVDIVYSKVRRKRAKIKKKIPKKKIKITKLKNKHKNNNKVFENEMKNEMNIEMKENENRLKMIKPLRSPTEQETRKLFGIALERLINMSMGNHIYCFNNINRIQSEGGGHWP